MTSKLTEHTKYKGAQKLQKQKGRLSLRDPFIEYIIWFMEVQVGKRKVEIFKVSS